ncbi:CDC14A [Symbiodinium sp. CCMP2592]|nr:CDC14A [Symbiodinium sp. CCMP2592]
MVVSLGEIVVILLAADCGVRITSAIVDCYTLTVMTMVAVVHAKLADANLADKRIVHYCSHDPKKRANAATLISVFQVIVLGKPADEAYKPFQSVYPPFLPYRDATCGICTYSLTVLDCVKGMEKAIECGWFDWKQFDVDSYEFFEKESGGPGPGQAKANANRYSYFMQCDLF